VLEELQDECDLGGLGGAVSWVDGELGKLVEGEGLTKVAGFNEREGIPEEGLGRPISGVLVE
jgi:hypothetical protein